MKIILRDILNIYLNKYSSIYYSLSNEQKQQLTNKIYTLNHKSNQQTNLQHHPDNKQTNIIHPLLLSNKKSLTKQKNAQNTNSQFNSQFSKQDNILNTPKRLKTTLNSKGQITKLVNQNRQKYQFSLQQKNKLNQILNEKLKLQITNYVHQHKFYSQSLNINQLFLQLSHILIYCHNLSHQIVNSNLKSKSLPKIQTPSYIQQNIYKLSLYLNKQTNKQIFSVYQHILNSNSRSGISYQTLSKKLKTDIINISHYCCKLKKMRFIDWQHKKQGIVVFPKIYLDNINQFNSKSKSLDNKSDSKSHALTQINLKSQQKSFDYSKSFIFNQLTLNQNILINICSSNSVLQGGLTNQQIKYKIMKQAQNKMVRRTVQGMKYINKNAQRQGKVFQFKYKKQTQSIIKQIDKLRIQNSGIIQLTNNCRIYLNNNYSSYSNQSLQNQQLLQHIVNTKLTDYYSSIGIKQSKRQCTPLKLNRYIYILNYLQTYGPQTQLDLRRYIIQIQKDLQNYQGIIHKRSVIGILQGLKKIQLIQQIDSYYYPKWIQVQRKPKIIQQNYQNQDYYDILNLNNSSNYATNPHINKSITPNKYVNGIKKQKMDKLSKQKQQKNKKSLVQIPHQKIKMITKKQHLNQIFTQLLNYTFQKALKRVLRKGFHRIMYVQRKKQSIPMFISQKNIFHLLDQPDNIRDKRLQHGNTLQQFMRQINDFVLKQGKRLQGFPQIQYEVVKYVRRNPSKQGDNLRSKYGRLWRQKFQPLQQQGIIKLSENGYETNINFDRYLV